VPPSEPAWWYGRPGSSVAFALKPVGALYSALAERRLNRPATFRAPVPVICVGNFTAGGTGKTPFTLALLERLTAHGETPVILSRGYGGSMRGPHWVSPATDAASQVGDEPCLMAAHAPVMVARDRVAGARAILAGPHKVTVILMDDGLQNPHLAKDFTVAVVDGARGFGNGLVMPSGPLRAPLAAQFARVDAIVINHASDTSHVSPVGEDLRRVFTGPVLDAGLEVVDAAAWAGTSVIAFAGIGVPQRFFATLEALGANLVACCPYPDHHAFSDADAGRLLELARTSNATLVTTSKDKARLTGAVGRLGDLDRAVSALHVRMVVAPSDRVRLDALISGLLASQRPSALPRQCTDGASAP
jgi:tetraacyldisaccharide 4'-kinase